MQNYNKKRWEIWVSASSIAKKTVDAAITEGGRDKRTGVYDYH